MTRAMKSPDIQLLGHYASSFESTVLLQEKA